MGHRFLQSAEWHGLVEHINWRPRASRFRGFLTPAECDFLIAKVKARIQPAKHARMQCFSDCHLCT